MLQNTEDLGTPINTFLTAWTDVDSAKILEAKTFLTKNYKNIYDEEPHFTYFISPIPEYNLEKITSEMDRYFGNLQSFPVVLSALHAEPKKRFFSIPIDDPRLTTIHEDLVKICAKYRDGSIRAKDVARIKEGLRDPEEIENIRLFGYPREGQLFKTHVTIGEAGEIDDTEFIMVTENLKKLLEGVTGNDLMVKNVRLSFQVDAVVQTEKKELFGKTYGLI